MKKLLSSLAIISTLGVTGAALAQQGAQFEYGPYANLGAGVGIFSSSDDDFDFSVTGFNARAGLGVIEPINQDVNPFFAGVEADGDYYHAVDNNIFGADASVIIGKQLNQQFAVYGKGGMNYLTNSGAHAYGPLVGGGFDYQIAPRVQLTSEATYGFDTDHLRVTTITAGLKFALN